MAAVYGSSMTAPLAQETNGEPGRSPAGQPDGLYRYEPVPPAYYDEDGYLCEDNAAQEEWHKYQTSTWYLVLNQRLPTATVCSDLAVHYREGDRGATIVPDLFVALRVLPDRNRLSYKLWRDPVPELVIEALSQDTAAADVGVKHATYEHMGVREYWLFDPQGLALSTPLVGYSLLDGAYQPMDADRNGLHHSSVLGMYLHIRAGELRFRDPAMGEDLRTLAESESERLAEKRRADHAERRAEAAERELARLRLRL